jgi:hypothetical protein
MFLISGRDHGGNNYPVIRGFNSTTSPLNMSKLYSTIYQPILIFKELVLLSMNDNTNGWAIYVNND